MRLGGNALLTHVALTATARYFTHDRGKALSIAGLGSAIGEPCFGVAVVYLIASWNWRGVLCAVALLALMLILIAHALIRANARFREPHKSAPVVLDDVAHEMSKPRAAVNAQYWVKSTLLFVLSPLIVTALIFHQSVVAQSKGLPLEWFAVTFSAFAVTRAVGSLMIGPVIDRIGSTWLFALHLLPFSLGVVLLAAFPGAWVVPVSWLFTGATGGLAATLQVAVIAEHVAPQRLGSLRGLAARSPISRARPGRRFMARSSPAGSRYRSCYGHRPQRCSQRPGSARMQRATSLEAHVCGAYDFRVLLDFLLEIGAELFRRAADGLGAVSRDRVAHVGRLQDSHDLAVQTRHDLARRARGDEHGVPVVRVEPGYMESASAAPA